MRSVPEQQGGCGARSPQLERCLKRILMALVAACQAARRAGWPQVNRALVLCRCAGSALKRSRPQRLHPRGRWVQADRQTAAGGVAVFVWTVACRGGGSLLLQCATVVVGWPGRAGALCVPHSATAAVTLPLGAVEVEMRAMCDW